MEPVAGGDTQPIRVLSRGGSRKSERTRKAKRQAQRLANARLSNPDQLDQVVEVTRRPQWLALLAIFLLLAVAIVVSVQVPVRLTVQGEGILINSGGILTITADTEGRLVELLVGLGDPVSEGQLVALVAQPRLEQELESRQAELAEARSRRDTIRGFQNRAETTREKTIASQRRALEERFAYAVERRELLQKRMTTEEELFEGGIIPRRQLNESRTELNDAHDAINTIENEIEAFSEVLTSANLVQQRELLELELEIQGLERQATSLELALRRLREIRSPYAGRVVELKVNRGEILTRNAALVSLLPGNIAQVSEDGDLQAVLFVPPAEGKKVQAGMEVLLAPTSVKREEYGYLLGEVSTVAEVPSTPEGMMRVLQNSQLVAQLSRDHAPFQVLVHLKRDATSSGYAWSSSQGPPASINVGTLCTGEVVTGHQRLIRAVVPAIGRLLDEEAGEGG